MADLRDAELASAAVMVGRRNRVTRTARATRGGVSPGGRRCLPRHECDTDRSEEESLMRAAARLIAVLILAAAGQRTPDVA